MDCRRAGLRFRTTPGRGAGFARPRPHGSISSARRAAEPRPSARVAPGGRLAAARLQGADLAELVRSLDEGAALGTVTLELPAARVDAGLEIGSGSLVVVLVGQIVSSAGDRCGRVLPMYPGHRRPPTSRAGGRRIAAKGPPRHAPMATSHL